MKFLSSIVFALSLLFSVYSPFATAVNINTASKEEIQKELTGIGESKAEAIIRYRENTGGFKSVDELLEVKGIGKATLEKNREKIELK